MAKYLDSNGVLYLWGKIKALFNQAGDMKKATYDTNGNGIVDNAEKVGGFTVGTNVPANAKFTDTVYTHPTYTAKASGLYKVTVDFLGHISAVTAVTKADITELGIPAQDTTYPVASASQNGLLSSMLFSKLNELPTGSTIESTYAKKTDITGMYKYKGSVTNASGLPENAEVGDVYNIVNSSQYGGAGMNVGWTGEVWDPLGEIFNIESITNAEIDAICV